ncbi:MAG: class I SAM-dependent methyltransferase, partial [Nitrospinales bacterium]
MATQSIQDHSKQVTRANQDMHDVLANYYDASNLIMLEEGVDSQVRIENVVKDLAVKTSGDCLIDVGCGTGNILKFSEIYFKKSLGIDVSQEMLLRNKDKKSELVRGDIHYLPFKSNHADAVSCFSVVHHLYEFELLFREVFRVLKPNGYFYSDNDPNKFSTDLHDLNKQSKLFRSLMGIYFIPLRFSKSHREKTRLLKEFRDSLNEKEMGEDFD